MLSICLCGYNLDSSFNLTLVVWRNMTGHIKKDLEKKTHSECLDHGSVCFFITTLLKHVSL